ncbi:hypothetical protein HPP92_023390 [Vanilla planifolia]|uniref:Uncharacterized protein n=1 Tax=Vanilla planifolia TaxID=51239 RepID=A0A835PZD0_VANPL|nr:hypothetical protein HPP92_023390 [Vanilla planifolia]
MESFSLEKQRCVTHLSGVVYAEKAVNRKKTKAEREDEEEGSWPRKGKSSASVMLEGYVGIRGEGEEKGSDGGGDVVGRTKSLTDEDLEELKGCLDLGFGFSYDEIPELCNTLPALELCYSMSQKFLDEEQHKPSVNGAAEAGDVFGPAGTAPSSMPIAIWKISSPGDDPDDVKARLKYWAQALACLC